MLVIPVYIAIMSVIRGPTDRISFSQIVNHLVDEFPDMDKEEGSFNCNGNDIPKNHVIRKWLEQLRDNDWWIPWMDNTTEVTFYVGEYREGDSEDPAVQ